MTDMGIAWGWLVSALGIFFLGGFGPRIQRADAVLLGGGSTGVMTQQIAPVAYQATHPGIYIY
jgi:hypothetical protein